MEAMKEILDQKRRELGTGNLGSWGQVWVRQQDSNQPGEPSHGGSRTEPSSED